MCVPRKISNYVDVVDVNVDVNDPGKYVDMDEEHWTYW